MLNGRAGRVPAALCREPNTPKLPPVAELGNLPTRARSRRAVVICFSESFPLSSLEHFARLSLSNETVSWTMDARQQVYV